MGFLHQLHLLLWKNVTLKRRSPWVLAFEIFIPLVLFFILLGLRQKKPTISVKEVCKFQPLSAPFPSDDPQVVWEMTDRFLAAFLIPLPTLLFALPSLGLWDGSGGLGGVSLLGR
uniref:ATP binding cassette subfamily A member 7 n=1 Tax=Vombatus ursinus TaxID=29139 RepID=A0A4X2KD62_VOMUR